MALSSQFLDMDDLHPIDIVEHLAADQQWEFDRIGDNQIAMVVDGQWRIYTLTLAWADYDETLRLICTFDMDPPADRQDALHAALNAVNDNIWAGAFTYWAQQNLMVYRYGLILAGGQIASADQIDTMISAAVSAAERYYPVFQLVTWGKRELGDAMQLAIAETCGRA